MNLGAIASRVARRHCDREHTGASPCPICAELRYIVLEAIGEFVADLAADVQIHLERS